MVEIFVRLMLTETVLQAGICVHQISVYTTMVAKTRLFREVHITMPALDNIILQLPGKGSFFIVWPSINEPHRFFGSRRFQYDVTNRSGCL